MRLLGADGVEVASLDLRAGYAVARLAVRAAEEDALRRRLSPRATALLDAFPRSGGARAVHVDVRNRHWAALVEELVAGLSRLR